MDVLINVFVGLHIIGIASLLGGFLTQMKAMSAGTARFVPAMLHGALTMLVTGVALVGLNQADGQHPEHHQDRREARDPDRDPGPGLREAGRRDRSRSRCSARSAASRVANIFIALLWT